MGIDYSKFAFPKPSRTEKKTKQKIKGKKHSQTKKTDINKETKIKVWERDRYSCIFCHKKVPWNYANAHYIKRSAGGLGIEKNIFTACKDCHSKQENCKEMTQTAGRYLKEIYGNEWKIEDLIYKKFK